jgi:hypothetical protein
MKEQLKGQEKKHLEDLRFYLKEKQQQKKRWKHSRYGKGCIHACDCAVSSHLLICCMSQDHVDENCQPDQFFLDEF